MKVPQNWVRCTPQCKWFRFWRRGGSISDKQVHMPISLSVEFTSISLWMFISPASSILTEKETRFLHWIPPSNFAGVPAFFPLFPTPRSQTSHGEIRQGMIPGFGSCNYLLKIPRAGRHGPTRADYDLECSVESKPSWKHRLDLRHQKKLKCWDNVPAAHLCTLAVPNWDFQTFNINH